MSASYAATGTAEGRKLRLYSRAPISDVDWEALGRADADDEDRTRAAWLDEVLAAPLVVGTAHPGVDPSDALHIYLHGSDAERAFACVVVSERRLDAMLDEAPTVVAGLSLEVAAGAVLTSDGVRAALESWAGRNFGKTPVFDLSPWLSPLDELVIDGEEAVPTLDWVAAVSTGPAEADPAYEEAA